MLFKRVSDKHGLTVAMSGIKLGDRLLQIGTSDPSLLAALGGKAGMSGRACVLAASTDEAARARHAAERSGVLLEVDVASPGSMPYEDGAFDIIVIDNREGVIANMRPEHRVATLQQARRVLAPRGRLVIIERAPRAGLGALLSRTAAPVDPHYQNTGGALTALAAEGFKAVRLLAEMDGLSFFEGMA
jgi:ubiquinone/menaquinone biosynthesis C-methylase UbiE